MLQFIDSARFIAISLSSLVNNNADMMMKNVKHAE